MSDGLRVSARGQRARLVRRVALVAVIAIAASAFLPLVHARSGHAGDCGVCSVLAHGSANVAHTAVAPSLPLPAVGPALGIREPTSSVPLRDFSLRRARAPPLASVPV